MTGLLLALLQISAFPPRSTPSHIPHGPPATTAPATAIPNDNRVAGGRVANGVYTLNLETREALWYPEGEGGPSILIAAFGEAGGPARAPGPMIRVPAGTEMRITVHNTLATPMRSLGLTARLGGGIH